MTRTIEIGGSYRFTYPNFGTPDGFPEHTAHSGQVVTVLRQLTEAECDAECQPMYEVKADDGWTGDVNADELAAPSPWSGAPDPVDPDNFWIDDRTGERVDAAGERTTLYPMEDWQHEVANGDTRRGYADWVYAKREADADEVTAA